MLSTVIFIIFIHSVIFCLLLGAVIAREYGLPCIVGATNATDIFATGDTVRLSGIRGVVERVQVEQEVENDK